MNLKRICDADNSQKRVQPKTKDELEEIIEKTIKEKGNNCDLNFIDTSLITDMSGIFRKFWKFNGDISKWDVSNVTDMEEMFLDSGFNGDISNWDVSNVRNMGGMFASSEFNGDLSNWDVSSVWGMSYMFATSEFSGDLSNWNVASLKYARSMFDDCPASIPSWYKDVTRRSDPSKMD